MQQAVREITEMTERLETSGLKREQGDAVIQAIANSIEKFAVTPEVLGKTIDKAFERADERERRRFEAVEKRMGERIEAVETRFGERVEDLDKRMGGRIEHLHKLSNEQFEQRDKRSDERFKQFSELMSEKFMLVHQEIKRTNERLDHHDKRFDGIDAKLSRIAGWMVTLLVALVGTLAGVVARGMWP